jgi:hypothetical protein
MLGSKLPVHSNRKGITAEDLARKRVAHWMHTHSRRLIFASQMTCFPAGEALLSIATQAVLQWKQVCLAGGPYTNLKQA